MTPPTICGHIGGMKICVDCRFARCLDPKMGPERDRWWAQAGAIVALLTAGGAAGLGWAKLLGI